MNEDFVNTRHTQCRPPPGIRLRENILNNGSEKKNNAIWLDNFLTLSQVIPHPLKKEYDCQHQNKTSQCFDLECDVDTVEIHCRWLSCQVEGE